MRLAYMYFIIVNAVLALLGLAYLGRLYWLNKTRNTIERLEQKIYRKFNYNYLKKGEENEQNYLNQLDKHKAAKQQLNAIKQEYKLLKKTVFTTFLGITLPINKSVSIQNCISQIQQLNNSLNKTDNE